MSPRIKMFFFPIQPLPSPNVFHMSSELAGYFSKDKCVLVITSRQWHLQKSGIISEKNLRVFSHNLLQKTSPNKTFWSENVRNYFIHGNFLQKVICPDSCLFVPPVFDVSDFLLGSFLHAIAQWQSIILRNTKKEKSKWKIDPFWGKLKTRRKLAKFFCELTMLLWPWDLRWKVSLLLIIELPLKIWHNVSKHWSTVRNRKWHNIVLTKLLQLSTEKSSKLLFLQLRPLHLICHFSEKRLINRVVASAICGRHLL